MKLNRRNFCRCGCGKMTNTGNKYIYNHHKLKLPWEPKSLPQLCQCGCGGTANINKKYIHGHHSKFRKNTIQTTEKKSNSAKETWNIPEYREQHSKSMKSVYKDKNRNEKIGVTKIGNKYFFGKSHKEESKETIRQKNKLNSLELWKGSEFREKHTGENNSNWKGGISKIYPPYPLKWKTALKESIRNRDGHICQVCNKKEKDLKRKLHVHHVDYNKENCEENNLISLCHSCHIKTNHDQEKWLLLFNYTKNEVINE